VAVLADPVFEMDDPRVTKNKPKEKSEVQLAQADDRSIQSLEFVRTTRDFGVAGFDRLDFSREEAEEIVKYANDEKSLKALDFAASRALAKDATLAQYRIVHFAVHGLLNNIHPELSGMVLSLIDSLGAPQDGFLRLHEIYNLSLPADLVVLSACQTALGKEIKGEGLVSLTRGFMYARAARVVATLWSVNDKATAKLMQRFYQKMLGHDQMRPAAALRTAQIEMWKKREWKTPYYWAAFVLQGEWK
jgi:CHAT domain-containing protein